MTASLNYHVLLANFEGVPIQTAFDSIVGEPFGLQNAFDKLGKYIIVGSEGLIQTHPELTNYIDSNYDLWVIAAVGSNPENIHRPEAYTLISTLGPIGTAWAVRNPL